MGPDNLDEASVLRQLTQVLRSRKFVNSKRLSTFLRFGVEAALSGTTGVSEYSIATDVFKRPKDFDPRLDPIVRVQARRLRTKLLDYYSNEGVNDPIKIQLPLRSYIPVLELQEGPRAEKPAPVFRRLVVFPFVDLTSPAIPDAFIEGTMQELIHLLATAEAWTVISWKKRERLADCHAIATQLEGQATLSGTLRQDGPRLKVCAEVLSVRDLSVLWCYMTEVQSDGSIATQELLARQIYDSLGARFRCCLSAGSA